MAYGLAKDTEENIIYLLKRQLKNPKVGISIGWKYKGTWYVDDEETLTTEWKNVEKLSRKESTKILGFINNHRYQQ